MRTALLLKRRLFDLAAATSLVLCALTVAAAARSFFIHDYLVRRSYRLGDPTGHCAELRSNCGSVELGVYSYDEDPSRIEYGKLVPDAVPHGVAWTLSSFPAHFRAYRLYRFELRRDWYDMHGRGPYSWVLMPYWFPTLLFAVLPALRWGKWRRRSRPGSCSACGYELRSTPDRCPECGTVPTTKAARPGGAGG
jgi:hypothetical protein